MDNLVKFLQEAGMHSKEIKNVVNENVFGLRKRRQPNRSQSMQPRVVKQTLVSSVPSKENKKILVQEFVYQFNPSSFVIDYGNFRKGSKKQLVQWELKSIQLLTKMFEIVIKQRGIVQLLAIGKWQQTTAFLRKNFSEVQTFGDEELLKIYLDHLIEYQFALQGTPLNMKKGITKHNTLKNAIFIPQTDRITLQSKELQQQLLHEEVAIIQNAVKTLGLEDINLELIEKECGQQEVELRIQNPLDFGFNPYKLMNKDDKMTISQYCDYQKHYYDEIYCEEKFGDKLKGGRVFFAVNFQPQGGTILEKISSKLKDTVLGWALPTDMLSYLEQHINGCTNPQFYLKVKGCWTGGHQQNIGMCAININHGPSASEWYTVPVDEVERLRRTLKQKFRQDLYEHEGLWFEKINWFLENGIQIKRILQKPGDLVVSGPGTLHWVRGEGVSLHSAWNIFPEFHKSIVAAFHRSDENIKIKFRKSNTIPLKILILKHIDHAIHTLPQQTSDIMLTYLNRWLSEQQSQLAKYKLNMGDKQLRIEQKKLEEHQAFCKLCLQEVFVYFVDNWPDMGISCLHCLSQNYQTVKIDKTIYYRWSPGNMAMFIIQAKLKQLDPKKLRYCSGEHIGRECILTNKSFLQDEKVNSEKTSFLSKSDHKVADYSLKRQKYEDVQSKFQEPEPKKRIHKQSLRTPKQQGQFSEKSYKQNTKKYKNDKQSNQQQYYHKRDSYYNRNDRYSKSEREDNYKKEEDQYKQKERERERSREHKRTYDRRDQDEDNEGPKSHFKKIQKNSDYSKNYRKSYDHENNERVSETKEIQNNRPYKQYNNSNGYSNNQSYNNNNYYNRNSFRNNNSNNSNNNYSNNRGNYNNNSNNYNNNSYNTYRGGNYQNKRTADEDTNREFNIKNQYLGDDSKPHRKRSASQTSY